MAMDYNAEMPGAAATAAALAPLVRTHSLVLAQTSSATSAFPCGGTATAKFLPGINSTSSPHLVTAYLYWTAVSAGRSTVKRHTSPSCHASLRALTGDQDPSASESPVMSTSWPKGTWWGSWNVTFAVVGLASSGSKKAPSTWVPSTGAATRSAVVPLARDPTSRTVAPTRLAAALLEPAPLRASASRAVASRAIAPVGSEGVLLEVMVGRSLSGSASG